MITITLPFPPTTNNLFISRGHKRIKSPRYREWIDEAGWEILASRPQPMRGPYTILINLGKPDGKRRDVWNYEKAISDLLVTHGIIEDDSQCEGGCIRWAKEVPRGRAEIVIEPYLDLVANDAEEAQQSAA